MHQYRIEVSEYINATEAKAVPELTLYADNHEDARVLCNEYANQVKEDGSKKYRVRLYILCYKYVAKDEYFAQFQA